MSENISGSQLKLVANGPILLEGDFKIYDPKGELMETKDKVWLCRCGQSVKKPFCDGAHKTCGFEA